MSPLAELEQRGSEPKGITAEVTPPATSGGGWVSIEQVLDCHGRAPYLVVESYLVLGERGAA